MTRFTIGGAIVLALVVGIAFATLQPRDAAAGTATQAEAQGLSLITDTPDQGYDLAIALARRAVRATQPDTEVLHALRPTYAEDAEALIAASHVVAVHFQTIAAANNYWR